MNGLAELGRLILEKSWTIGVLLAITFGLAIVAQAHGAHFPPLVQEWAWPLALLGIALIVLSSVNLVFTQGWVAWHRHKERSASGRAAIANLETLTDREAHALYEALHSGKSRFQMSPSSIGYNLYSKGIFVLVHAVWTHAGSVYEIHPAILKRKAPLLDRLGKRLQSSPPQPLEYSHNPNSWMER